MLLDKGRVRYWVVRLTGVPDRVDNDGRPYSQPEGGYDKWVWDHLYVRGAVLTHAGVDTGVVSRDLRIDLTFMTTRPMMEEDLDAAVALGIERRQADLNDVASWFAVRSFPPGEPSPQFYRAIRPSERRNPLALLAIAVVVLGLIAQGGKGMRHE